MVTSGLLQEEGPTQPFYLINTHSITFPRRPASREPDNCANCTPWAGP